MKFPSRDEVEALRERYPAGTILELLEMSDPQAPTFRTRGEVMGVDDAGNILMKWENGSSLSLIPGEDSFRIVEEE